MSKGFFKEILAPPVEELPVATIRTDEYEVIICEGASDTFMEYIPYIGGECMKLI
jgi:hypothetical protein